MPDFVGLFVLACFIAAVGWGIALGEIVTHHFLNRDRHD